jgi:trimethylamine--corrinoid protein Co-methyltransferase
MTENARKRKRQRKQHGRPPPNTYSQPIRLPHSHFTVLTEPQVEQIHEASLMILERTGVVFRNDTAVSLFKQTGAKTNGQHVLIPRELIQHCLATVPAQYVLHGRHPANTITIGGDWCAVMPGGGPPFVLDWDGTRRPGTLADVENFARLSQISPGIHVMARKVVEAQDLPPATRHLDCWGAILTLTDKPGQSGFVHGRAEAEDVLQMLAIVHGGEAAIDGRPVAHCSINANSPLLYDSPMLESLLAFAQAGQPILITPFVMAGVTGPTTLAGTLAQHNAEVLAGLALVQLVRPGTPVLYGTATSNIDMRSGAPAIGSPESALSIAACAQMARFYHLPCRGGGALTDSPVPDEQSNYERMFTLMTSIMSGINFLMHGLGILESYLTLSYAQFVIDLELLAMIRQLAQPITISPDTLTLDTIHEVGPGGHYLDTAHTLAHYREAHFLPQISRRQSYEQWRAEGAKNVRIWAQTRYEEMMASYRQPPIATAVADELANFIEKRKLKLGLSRS